MDLHFFLHQNRRKKFQRLLEGLQSRPVVADSHQFERAQAPDPHLSEKQDLDLH
jgi:hypothetical protein